MNRVDFSSEYAEEARLTNLLDNLMGAKLEELDLSEEIIQTLQRIKSRVEKARKIALVGGSLVVVVGAAVGYTIGQHPDIQKINSPEISAAIGGVTGGLLTFLAHYFDQTTFTGPRLDAFLKKNNLSLPEYSGNAERD